MFAFKGLLAGVNTFMLFEVVLELEGLATVAALELPKVGAVLVVGHVAL